MHFFYTNFMSVFLDLCRGLNAASVYARNITVSHKYQITSMEGQLRNALIFKKFMACNLADAGPNGRTV